MGDRMNKEYFEDWYDDQRLEVKCSFLDNFSKEDLKWFIEEWYLDEFIEGHEEEFEEHKKECFEWHLEKLKGR